MQETALVVKEPFEKYAKGDMITDPDAVDYILASENKQHVIKILTEVQP